MGDLLLDIYTWSCRHLEQPIMLGYVLHKVNGQTPGSVLLLLRQKDSLRPNVEIQIEYTPDQDPLYQAIFSFLPFNINLPRPDRLRVDLVSQKEVIEWLKTGHKRIQFPSNADLGA